MSLAVDNEPAETNAAKQPAERKVALVSITFASIISIVLLIREVRAGSHNVSFATLLTVSSVVVCIATAISMRKQKGAAPPKWALLTYPLMAFATAFVPFSASWTSQEGLGLSPALLPGLTLFVCLVAPFAVPNQIAFGLGSILPKCLVMSAAMHFTDNSDWGIFASNHLVSPQTAIGGLALFTGVTSTIFLGLKMKLPTWVMILIGAVITFPCILKIEMPLVVFHLL